MSKIMIALGGNALGNTPQEQLSLVKETAKLIVDLIEDGHHVVIAHGNGPQVGMINLAFEVGNKTNDKIPLVQFPECGSMSQGYIGYHLQMALKNELITRGVQKNVASIVTQVLVDGDDPAFENPTKPIGGFYTKEEAKELAKTKGYTMVEDSGRGYRRVVPSPKPLGIVEIEVIRDLVEKGHVVIAVGGGGIPTVEENGQLKGVSAVIDKDLASEKLAELLDCDTLFILTAVETILLDFGKPTQRQLRKANLKEMEEYVNEGHFAPGSMLPKVISAMEFVRSNNGRTAIITSLENAKEAINGKTGTLISN